MFFYYFCKILVIEYLSACALQISCYYQSIISFIPATSDLRSCYLSLAREVFPDACPSIAHDQLMHTPSSLQVTADRDGDTPLTLSP